MRPTRNLMRPRTTPSVVRGKVIARARTSAIETAISGDIVRMRRSGGPPRQGDEVATGSPARVAERARRGRAELQAVTGTQLVLGIALAEQQPALQHPDLLVDERIGVGRVGDAR